MEFQHNLPQTGRQYVAILEPRQTLKRKSAHASDTEPPIKDQKLLDSSLLSAPAQSQSRFYSYPGLTDNRPNSVDYLPTPAPPRAQAHQMSNHRSVPPVHSHCIANFGLATQKPNLDHSSQLPVEAEAHDMTDLGPVTKKPKLSYSSLPPGQIRSSILNVDPEHAKAEFNQKQAQRWRELQGLHNSLLVQSTPSGTSLMPSNSNVYGYGGTQSSKAQYDAYGSSDLHVHPVDNSSVKSLLAKSPGVDAHHVRKQKFYDLCHHSPAPNTITQIRPIFNEVPLHHPPAAQDQIRKPHPSSTETIYRPSPVQKPNTEASLAFGGEISETCLPLGDQTSNSLSAVTSTLKNPILSSSYLNNGCDTTTTNSDQVAALDSGHDVGEKAAAASSFVPSPSPGSNLRDSTRPASSCEVSSVGPARNKGGRPRGRKPRPPKTPKGPTRFQKNHPVKAKVNGNTQRMKVCTSCIKAGKIVKG